MSEAFAIVLQSGIQLNVFGSKYKRTRGSHDVQFVEEPKQVKHLGSHITQNEFVWGSVK